MATTNYDFSDAQPASFDLIPDKTVAPIIIKVQAGDPTTPENAFAITKTGLYQLVLECVVSEGEFAKRKLWQRLTMGARQGVTLTEGQQKGVDISRSLLRAILEAARGFATTDDSAEAMAARRIDSMFELDGLEVWAEIGVEKGKDGYADKNKINKIVNRMAGAAAASRPAPSRPAPATAKKAAWA